MSSEVRLSTGADVVDYLLGRSQTDGCIVIANQSSSANLRWANSTLTTNGSTKQHSVTVISIDGRKVGSRSGTSFLRSDLEALLTAAEADARAASDAEDFSPLLDGDNNDVNFEAEAAPGGVDVFDRFAPDLGAAFTSSGIELFGFANHEVTTTWLGTSTGLRRRHEDRNGSVEWNAKNGTPRGSAWVGQATKDFTDVSVDATVVELQRRLGWSANTVDLPAGRYETILPPSAVADLLIYAYWSAAGRDAAEGRSVFSRAGGGTRIGDRLADATLQLYSDPIDEILAARPFEVTAGSSATSSVFDNGLPLSRTDWIKGGVLHSLLETRASGRERKVRATPAIENLILETSGTKSVDQMVATTERGLLLTCLWYIREVDPQTLLLTGLTRDGVYLVEGGEVRGAVNNFRWNESPIGLLGRIDEAGASLNTLPREWADWFTKTRMPTLRISDFNMSTVSPAN